MFMDPLFVPQHLYFSDFRAHISFGYKLGSPNAYVKQVRDLISHIANIDLLQYAEELLCIENRALCA